MISHGQLFAVVLVTIAAFLALVSLTGGVVEMAWLREVEFTVTAVGLALAYFNLRGWRWRWLQGWFVKRPHLWGEWQITLNSDWNDPRTGQGVEPINATFSIMQSYTTLHVRMMSSQSDGELVCASLLKKEDGGFRLVGTYRNEPHIMQRATSPIHYGTFLMDIEGSSNAPTAMRGHYWTDRGTRGEMLAARVGRTE